ncbi:MAG: hypothetical protein IBX69_03325 [Anaerolineales bacterium]|nr:hypothetical protein [Anaerolineales bacterium]
MKKTMLSSNRAEELRRKRTRQTQSRPRTVGASRGSKDSSPTQPPVLGRRGIVGDVFSSKQTTNKKVKRRYDLSLGASGAEMRLPSLPAIHLGWRLVSGVMVAGLLFCIYTLWTSPDFKVNAATIEGLERVTWEEVILVAGVLDKPIFIIEPPKVQEDLHRAFPEFANIFVKVELPAKVLILVEERQPILAWKESQHVLWVDKYGISFPPRGESAPEITVEALSPLSQSIPESIFDDEILDHQLLSIDMVSAIMALSVKSPENTPLVYIQDHGLGWRDQRGWDVFFGRYDEEVEMKIDLYEAIIEYLAKQQTQPVLISVEHLHAPYYRLEN